MACGCNKKKNNRKNIVSKGKKVLSKKSMPLITVRKQNPVKKKTK